MTRRIAQQFVIAVCLLALTLAPLLHTAPSVAGQASGGFHWARKQVPFTLPVGDNVSGNWPSLMRAAMGEWNKNDTVTLKEVAGTAGAQQCNKTVGRIEVCNFNYGTQEGWLGLTKLYFNEKGDHIEAVTLQLNDSFFNQKNGQYNNDMARRHTICHELGHTMGLEHTNTTSCMNDSQFSVFNYVKPIKDDFRELARIYKHKDSFTTIDAKQPKDKKKDKDKSKKDKKNKKGKKNKRQNGRTRKRDQARNESFFDPNALQASGSADETVTVETAPDGKKVVTFTTWVEQRG